MSNDATVAKKDGEFVEIEQTVNHRFIQEFDRVKFILHERRTNKQGHRETIFGIVSEDR